MFASLLCEHVQTIPKTDVGAEALGRPLSPARMREVEAALLVLLGIDIEGA